ALFQRLHYGIPPGSYSSRLIKLQAQGKVALETRQQSCLIVISQSSHVCASGRGAHDRRCENRFPNRVAGTVATKRIEGNGGSSARKPMLSTERPGDARVCREFTRRIPQLSNLSRDDPTALEVCIDRTANRHQPARTRCVRYQKKPAVLKRFDPARRRIRTLFKSHRCDCRDLRSKTIFADEFWQRPRRNDCPFRQVV